MKIVYSDNGIVVIIKPYGILSQSDCKGTDSAVEMLEEQLECNIYPVHRLDKTTSGLMVFAKTKDAAAKLSEQIQNSIFTAPFSRCITKLIQ